ncbi:vanadium-dependent haloperoxidase [Flavitalea sp.]|nr:vanadium-dependent haloperoxidase [Flavitalea sp.]
MPYSELPSSDFYKSAQDVYDVGKALTTEQKTIANFWADVGGVGVNYPGPGHLVAIITDVLQEKDAKLGQAAEIYAKTGIAHKDAFYRIWKTKYLHNLIRPVTYIKKFIDPGWLPHLITPAYPDYPSGLAGIYTPIMRVLTREFGDIPVTDKTYVWNGSAARHYASFTKLAEEAAISRLYGGIHYRWTQNYTLEIGKKFGDEIADINLTPSKSKSGY